MAPQNKQQKRPVEPKKNGYFFYGTEGYKNKHHTKYHVWCGKKGIFLI